MSAANEHAPTPSTKFDEDHIPAPFAAFPRVTDASHRRRYAILAPFTPFYNIYTSFNPAPNILRVTFSTASPGRRCASICHVVIFRCPYTSPHRPCCVLHILFHIYFAFILWNMPSILFHMLTYIYAKIIIRNVGIKYCRITTHNKKKILL